MKQRIAELPMLTTPKPKKELIMYLCAAREAVSAVLLAERNSQQMPIYFVSHDLQVPKVNYNSMEKLVLALAKDIYPSPSLGRLHRQEAGRGWQVQVEEAITDLWTLFTDESSSLEGSGAGLIFTNPEEMEFTYALRFEYNASNNEAKYEDRGCPTTHTEQIGVTKFRGQKLTPDWPGRYRQFKKFSIEQVPRSENKKADALSKIASTSFAYLTKQVLVEVQKKKSIEEKEILMVVEEEGHSWMTPLLEYLTDDMLLTEAKRARAIKIKSRQYAMIDGNGYSRKGAKRKPKTNKSKHGVERAKSKCMRTRSKARRLQQQQVHPNLVEPPKDTMADNRTMAELLQAPTEGYEDAIVVPEIEAANFEIKHGLLTLVQNKQFPLLGT
ncbi:reverse transcriptase domain-containing protein [Tanacetum coccineum]